MFIGGLTSIGVKFPVDDGNRAKDAVRFSVTSRKFTISESGCENTGSAKSLIGIAPARQK